MKAPIQAAEYLQRITGEPVHLRPLPAERLRGLPALLARGHDFLEWSWLGQTLVLAVLPAANDDEQVETAGLRKRQQTLAAHFRVPVVLVLPALQAYRRDRLVLLGVPFLVPGTQLFLPPFANLCERYAREVHSARLSAAAQATVLYQLLHKPAAPLQLNVWAEKLGYSPMTLTKVRDELVAAGLCAPPATVRARGLHFLHQGRELWEHARPSLRSPVARRMWMQFHGLPPEGMARAGMTALAEVTMVEGDPLPTYACRSTAVDGLLQGSFLERREHREEANSLLECWRYDPCLLAPGGRGSVDPLSLYLSLADSDDERVRLACAELLEGWTW
jgi:hypothetical protein